MYTGSLRSLIDELGRLPGIGPKSAQRIAFHLLKVPADDARRLATAIVEVKEKTVLCERCLNVADAGELCPICADDRRDASILCVVEDPRDVVAVERTRQFSGRYHVLHGSLSPLEGRGPDEIKIAELLARLEPEGVAEVILCTGSNLEGDATALYLGKLLGPLGLTVTRIATGLPVGGDLEYADELTLGRALAGRRNVAESA